MKKQAVLLLTMLLAAGDAAAAMDCNKEMFTELTEQYVCLSPTLKKINNNVRRAEENLFARAEQAREALSALKSEKNKNTKAEQKSAESNANAEVEFYDNIVSMMRAEDNRLKKCRDEKCLIDGYEKYKEKLKQAERANQCSTLQIPDECEIYFYSDNNTSTRSKHYSISQEYYTFNGQVNVNRPNKCVYLFLSSQYARVWNVQVTKDTDLRRIFIGGDDNQAVSGYPEKTKVIIGLDTDLAKNAEMCFNRYIPQEKAVQFFARHNIGSDRVNIIYDGRIGDNAPLSEYAVSDRFSGSGQTEGLRPRDEGWKQLIADGKARRLTDADLEKMKVDGVVNLDNEHFYLKPSDYKFIYQYGASGTGGYVLTAPVERLPAGAEHERVFLAPGVTPPSDLKLIQTFANMARKPDMFSNAYMMLPLKEKPQFADCNHPQAPNEKVICADDELRTKNQEVKEAVATVTDNEDRRIVDIFTAYAAYRLRGCENRNCLLNIYKYAESWLKKREYSDEYKEKEPVRCQLKNIDDNCEVYAYSSNGEPHKEKELFICEQNVTYSANVKVNRPHKCVVLLLSSYTPVIWNIYTTPNTDLRAVLVGGYYEQMVRGMKAGVQTKNRHGRSMDDSMDRCLNYYFAKDEIADAVEELNIGLKNVRVLDKPVIGEEMDLSAYEYDPQIVDGKFLVPDVPPEDIGLELLIKEGKIRKVSRNDIARIKAAGYSFLSGVSSKENRNPFMYDVRRTYVLLREFEKLPAGLAGGSRIMLMVPKDMRVPDNNGGHNDFYGVDLPASEFWEDK